MVGNKYVDNRGRVAGASRTGFERGLKDVRVWIGVYIHTYTLHISIYLPTYLQGT